MPTGLGDEQLWISATNDNTGTSTAFDDQSGNGNNGTASGTLVVADSSEGGSYAFELDGIDDYIDTGSTTVHQNTVFSYSFWLNASSSSSGTEGTAGSYETSGGNRGPLAASLSGDNKLTWLYMSLGSSYNAAQSLKSSGDVYDSTWRHVTCEFDGDNNEVKIYIDGSLDSSKTASVPNTVNISTALKFGAGSGGFTDGKMDDIRVYNRALTQAEVTHLATSRGVEGPPPVGLGTEKAWLCPSLNDSADDISGTGTYAYNGGLTTTSNTGEGGTLAYDYDQSAAKAILQDATENIDNTDSFSVSWWMNPSVLNPSTNHYVADCRSKTGGSYNGWGLYLRNNSGVLNLGCLIYRGSRVGANNGLEIDSSASSRLNVWTHCTVNWDNTTNTWTLFVDGVSTDTYVPAVTGGPAVASGTHMAVGNYSPATSSIYSPIMLMDDFRVHNRTLTQAEITHLATSRGIEGSPSTPATQYNAFITHAFTQLFQTRLR